MTDTRTIDFNSVAQGGLEDVAIKKASLSDLSFRGAEMKQALIPNPSNITIIRTTLSKVKSYHFMLIHCIFTIVISYNMILRLTEPRSPSDVTTWYSITTVHHSLWRALLSWTVLFLRGLSSVARRDLISYKYRKTSKHTVTALGGTLWLFSNISIGSCHS